MASEFASIVNPAPIPYIVFSPVPVASPNLINSPPQAKVTSSTADSYKYVLPPPSKYILLVAPTEIEVVATFKANVFTPSPSVNATKVVVSPPVNGNANID